MIIGRLDLDDYCAHVSFITSGAARAECAPQTQATQLFMLPDSMQALHSKADKSELELTHYVTLKS